MAVARLKANARGLRATYVQIISTTEPHQTSTYCFDNRYQIRGFAFREATAGHGTEKKMVVRGTCFSVSPDGLVLTNHHVVENTQKIMVRFEDGTETEAKIITTSAAIDLALLRLKTPHSAYLTLAKPDKLQIGQEVFTMGYPVPTILGSSVKYTEGTISSLRGSKDEESHLQISVPVQPGNSGGPLVTNSGEVVGVVTSTADPDRFKKETGGSLPQNVNWAVKALYAHSFFDQPEALSPTPDREAAIERVRSAVCRIEDKGSAAPSDSFPGGPPAFVC